MTITEILVACDTVECGYRLVSLDDGRFAFIWGNIRAHVGDTIPQDAIDAPLCHRGVTVCDEYGAAEEAYRQCAESLSDSGATAAAKEMVRALDAEESGSLKRAIRFHQIDREYIVIDDGCNILWCGRDRDRANEVADEIERDHDRGCMVRERLPSDVVPSDVVVS